MFICLLNDLDEVPTCGSEIVAYADDILLFRVIETQTGFQSLQDDFNRLSNWAAANHLLFTPKKCVYIRFGRNRAQQNEKIYVLNGEWPQCEEEVKYLGLHVDRKVKWKFSAENLASKLRKRVKHINSLFKLRNTSAKGTLSLFDYCCPLITPTDKTSQNQLEKWVKEIR